MTPEAVYKKLYSLKIAVCVAFIVSVLFSFKLWISERVYPLTPVLNFLKPFPLQLDLIIVGILCGLLIWSITTKRYLVIFSVVGLACILFLQDQSRLYPSFYEYTILLVLLGLYLKKPEEKEGAQILFLCQFILVAIYFWSGISKLNPYFIHNVFPWLIGPLHLPLYKLFPDFFGLVVACSEIIFGVFLIIPRFRKIALYELLLMHGFLFFLIGPFRTDWNPGAWTWNIASACFLYILFSNTNKLEIINTLKISEYFSKVSLVVLVLVGLLPALNMVNLWDSALSFNVYSGNTNEAVVSMNKEAYDQINKEAQSVAYVDSSNNYYIYLDNWNILEFHAGAYPEIRIFKNVLKTLCQETAQDPSLRLIITEKAHIFSSQQKINILACNSNV